MSSAPTEASAPTMLYKRVPGTALTLPAVALGTWMTFSKESVVEQVDAGFALARQAYEAGAYFFDTAELYNCGKAETMLGQIIKRGVDEGVWTRDRLLIATKIYFGDEEGASGDKNERGLSTKHLFCGLQRSLARLQLDYADIVFCHRPDPLADIETVCRFFHNMMSGPNPKALYWGTSEWPAWMVAQAHEICGRFGWPRPRLEQVEFSMAERQKLENLRPLIERPGKRGEGVIGTTTWSPLRSGVLTLKYLDRETGKIKLPPGTRLSDPKCEWLRKWVLPCAEKMHPALLRLEKEVLPKTAGLTPHCAAPTLTQLVLAWTVYHSTATCVLIGARTPEQLTENLGAVQLAKVFTPELMGEINAVLANTPLTFTPDTRI